MKPKIVILIVLILGFSSICIAQNPEQLYQKALVKEEGEGALQEAIELFTEVAYNPESENALQAKAKLHLGMCYEKLGMNKAREVYNDVINNYPYQQNEVALARERVMKLDEHLVDIDQSVKKHIETGNELFSRWEYGEAIREYEKAIDLDPDGLLALNAKYYIGQSQFKSGQYEKALKTFSSLAKEYPESNIAPVSELMISQVEHAIKNNSRPKPEVNADMNEIVDPETGITYRKVRTYSGKNDIIANTGGLNLSPDARFVVLENKVVPLDGSEPFVLVNKKDALRAVYAPGMKRAAFYADSAIWTVPTSPLTGKAVGIPEKLLTGSYKYQHIVSWSPDGNKIAFSRRDKNTLDDIWTISLKNKKLTPVFHANGILKRPVWSPDGQHIVYDGDGYFLAPVDGGDHKKITSGGGYPYWSPDSKWIIFWGWNDQRLFSMQTGQEKEFRTPAPVGRLLGFNPENNSMLFFRSSFGDSWRLKVVSVSGGPSFKPASDQPVYDSYWSENSDQIIAESEDENGNLVYMLVSMNNGKTVLIDMNAGIEGEPVPVAFSPDRRRLAFKIEKENGYKDLYVVPFSVEEAKIAGKARLIFKNWVGDGRADNVSFQWSEIGYKAALIHKGDIWMVSENEKPKQFTFTAQDEKWVTWSPDGKWISYLLRHKLTGSLHILSVDGKVDQKLHDDCRTYRWSPDSKGLIVMSSSELSRISNDGELLKDICDWKDLGVTEISNPIYSPDAKKLAFEAYNNDESLIFIYSFDEDCFRKVAGDVTDDTKYSLSWSPDGKWLSYLTYEQVKVRPEGILWEADFDEVKEKLLAGE